MPAPPCSSAETTASPLEALLEVRASEIHGLGAFARRAIPAEALIGEYVGPQVEENGPYVLWVDYDDGEQVAIDGRNELRYLNHSATPNAYFWGHELYALRDIAAGEELTWDYGEEFTAHLDSLDGAGREESASCDN